MSEPKPTFMDLFRALGTATHILEEMLKYPNLPQSLKLHLQAMHDIVEGAGFQTVPLSNIYVDVIPLGQAESAPEPERNTPE